MTKEEAIEKLHWFALDNRDKQIIDMAIEALQDRSKGEWKYNKNGLPYCSKCNKQWTYPTDFCPGCGADMRGDK